MSFKKSSKTGKIQEGPNYFLRFSATGPGFESPYRYHPSYISHDPGPRGRREAFLVTHSERSAAAGSTRRARRNGGSTANPDTMAIATPPAMSGAIDVRLVS